ncbi:MAG TPA: glycerophosphodiester phosphodiesterase family protein [Anaerolineae bacterium]|nr:glycerophosphodiester phosphodiesterase family protein [Anaerolineae bacterium]
MTNNPWRRERPLAVAHRGHSIEYPENTFEAYRKAIELGAEMIECDVNLTRDGVLVMMHDYTLDRTTNGTGRVNQATWGDIQSLDAGNKFNPQFAGARVPLTKDTIQLFREAGIYGCFEVKGGNSETAKEIASALIDLFVKENALETNLMSSYYHEALALAKARVPDLQLAPERLPDDAPPDPPEAVRQAKALHSQILQYQYTVMTPEVVRILHDNDIAVWSWSTTDEPSLVFSIDVGADAVMGDDVRLMMQVLNRMRPISAPSQVSQAPA